MNVLQNLERLQDHGKKLLMRITFHGFISSNSPQSSAMEIHLAAEKGQMEMFEKNLLKERVEEGASQIKNSLNHRNDKGLTPFHLASQNGHSLEISIIMKNSVEFKIDLNAKDKDGDTGFHLSCMYGRIEITEMLVKNSAEFNIDLNAKNFDGETAFHLACNGEEETVEILVKNSAKFNIDFNAKDNHMLVL